MRNVSDRITIRKAWNQGRIKVVRFLATAPLIECEIAERDGNLPCYLRADDVRAAGKEILQAMHAANGQ